MLSAIYFNTDNERKFFGTCNYNYYNYDFDNVGHG